MRCSGCLLILKLRAPHSLSPWTGVYGADFVSRQLQRPASIVCTPLCAAVLLLLFWGERVKNKRASFTKNMPFGGIFSAVNFPMGLKYHKSLAGWNCLSIVYVYFIIAFCFA
jgi:hypothetical protein